VPAEEIHFGDEHWLDRDYYAVAPCWASAERAQSAPRGRRSPCVEVLLALIEHARGRHRIPVQAVVCATGDMGQPWRIRHLDEVLGHINAYQGVWKATGAEIIYWFNRIGIA